MTGAPLPCPPTPPGPWGSWEEVMALAMEQARAAEAAGEVPVGAACLAADGTLLAAGRNAPIGSCDPTAHAEIACLRAAAQAVGNYRLPGSILVVTLEPCIMCLGAMVQARIAGLAFAARDPKAGAVASRLRGLRLPFHNHRFWVLEGPLAAQSSALLSGFFRQRRAGRREGA